jgi:hypothetical protein
VPSRKPTQEKVGKIIGKINKESHRIEKLDKDWRPVNWYEEWRFYGEENGSGYSVTAQFRWNEAQKQVDAS